MLAKLREEVKRFKAASALHALTVGFIGIGFTPTNSLATTCSDGAFSLGLNSRSSAQAHAQNRFKSRPELTPFSVDPSLWANSGLWRKSENPFQSGKGNWSLVLKNLINGQTLSVQVNSGFKATASDIVGQFAQVLETESGTSRTLVASPGAEPLKASLKSENIELETLEQIRLLIFRALVGTPVGMHKRQITFVLESAQDPARLTDDPPVFVAPDLTKIVLRPSFFMKSRIKPEGRDLALRHAVYELRVRQNYVPRAYVDAFGTQYILLLGNFIRLSLEPKAPFVDLPWLAPLVEIPEYRRMAIYQSLSTTEQSSDRYKLPQYLQSFTWQSLQRGLEVMRLFRDPVSSQRNFRDASWELARLTMLSVESQQADLAAINDRNNRRTLFESKYMHYLSIIDEAQRRLF